MPVLYAFGRVVDGQNYKHKHLPLAGESGGLLAAVDLAVSGWIRTLCNTNEEGRDIREVCQQNIN